jgi:hypothetical protein
VHTENKSINFFMSFIHIIHNISIFEYADQLDIDNICWRKLCEFILNVYGFFVFSVLSMF